jgi:hypothetical protein
VNNQPGPFERFSVRFEALPDDVPAAVRVRMFLKCALRSYRLKNIGFLDEQRADQAETEVVRFS